ncbi:MAG: prepilin-type N-terminal cleavage/methylation domain-containing protein [Bacillota bacterium]
MATVAGRIRRGVRRVLVDRRGFTLVEMLIVLAIIAILAAIAVPSFSRLTRSAKARACAENVRMIETAAQAWAADHNGEFPESLEVEGFEEYFKSGSVPTCPFGDEYDYNSETGTVTPHQH